MFKNPAHRFVTKGVEAAQYWAAAADTKPRTVKPHHPAHTLSFNNNWYKQTSFRVCRRFHKVSKSDYQLRRARVHQLGSHRTVFHEISYWSATRKCVGGLKFR